MQTKPELDRDGFRAIVEHCSIGVVIQHHGQAVYANRSAIECLRFAGEVELVGRAVEELLDRESYATLSSNFDKAGPDDDQLFIGDLKFRCQSGALIDAEVYHSGLVFGGVDSTMISFRDTTATKRLELELRQAQKLESIGRLSAGLAHEINTPIQYIGDSAYYVAEFVGSLLELLDKSRAHLRKLMTEREDSRGLAELAAEEEAADLDFIRAEGPKSVQRIIGGASRVARIVAAMKSFAHPGTVQAMPMDINAMVEDTLVIAGHELRDTATVVTDLAQLPSIYGYPADLNQALLNLVVNAAHAVADRPGAKEPGVIRIATRLYQDLVEIKIADNGCGMPEQVKQRIFEPFFTTKQMGRGTGVQKHGGMIDFESEVGAGTTFVLRLPLEPPA
jgi:PAS domain S-box-containing protein